MLIHSLGILLGMILGLLHRLLLLLLLVLIGIRCCRRLFLFRSLGLNLIGGILDLGLGFRLGL